MEPTERVPVPPSFWTFKPASWAVAVGVILGVIGTLVLTVVLQNLSYCPCRTGHAVPNVELGELQTSASTGGDHWLNLTVVGATSGVTTGGLGWKIVTPLGSTVTGWNVSVMVGMRALATYSCGATSWTSVVQVNSSEVMSFNTGGQNLLGSNDSIQAIGLNQGTVSGEYGPL